MFNYFFGVKEGTVQGMKNPSTYICSLSTPAAYVGYHF